MRNQDRLNRPNFFPVDMVFGKLSPELFEEQQTLPPVDQIRVRDRISRAGEEIGQAHLISHRGREDGKGQVKRTGDTFENVAQQRLSGKMWVRG
jgi:hypothetical protein